MGGRKDGKARQPLRRIDKAAMGIFLAALKRGERLQAAAQEAGFSLAGFYRVRDRDPAFAAAWREALELSAVPHFVAPNNRRRLQLKKVRRLRFDERRQGVFLAYFAGTCDATAAAEAAGICVSTVYRHRAVDADFAAAFDAALEQGYVALEAEAVRQRLEAQRRLREGVAPAGEMAVEFERVLALLTRWERRNGRLGARAVGHGHQRRWTFDEAIELLEKKLKALNVPIRPVPPDPDLPSEAP